MAQNLLTDDKSHSNLSLRESVAKRGTPATYDPDVAVRDELDSVTLR